VTHQDRERRAAGAAASPEAVPGPVTELLLAWGRGDEGARDALVPIVYDELRRRARRMFGRQPAGGSLPPTAVVHETFLRLVDQSRVAFRDRAHFFAVASRVMRHVLVDHARRRKAWRRGGRAVAVPFDEATLSAEGSPVDLLQLDEALQELAREHPRSADVVEMRYFGGLELDEVAEAVQTSVPTVKRDWALARAWLHRRLRA
jgi:RNA polymerase sigma factor (TIGR02999 family)